VPVGQGPASTATSAPARTGRLRNTRQAAAVEAALRDADGFRTAQDLFAELRRRGDRIGLTTVYRHLNMLAEQGRADVVHSAEGESQYRLCGVGSDSAEQPGEHHHHLVCRVCGRSVEVSGPEVEAWADRVSAAAGYTEISHTLEVFGLCPEHSARRTGRTHRN
jgi:Fur family ferric uptake transcriptional regulator